MSYLILLHDNNIFEALYSGTLNSELSSLLSIPEAVKEFEASLRLPITGNAESMFSNYYASIARLGISKK